MYTYIFEVSVLNREPIVVKAMRGWRPRRARRVSVLNREPIVVKEADQRRETALKELFQCSIVSR